MIQNSLEETVNLSFVLDSTQPQEMPVFLTVIMYFEGFTSMLTVSRRLEKSHFVFTFGVGPSDIVEKVAYLISYDCVKYMISEF